MSNKSIICPHKLPWGPSGWKGAWGTQVEAKNWVLPNVRSYLRRVYRRWNKTPCQRYKVEGWEAKDGKFHLDLGKAFSPWGWPGDEKGCQRGCGPPILGDTPNSMRHSCKQPDLSQTCSETSRGSFKSKLFHISAILMFNCLHCQEIRC